MTVTSLVTLDDVYDTLNIKNPDGTDDGELQGFIDAAQAVIEDIVGPVVPQTYTEVHSGRGPSIVLDHTPVISVTSVTEYIGVTPYALSDAELGGSTSAYSYSLDDPTAGIVSRRYNGLVGGFAAGNRNIQIVYVAGQATVPANVRLAALELIRMQWQPQQSGNLPGVGTDDFSGINVMGFFVPNRVRELLVASQRGPAIA